MYFSQRICCVDVGSVWAEPEPCVPRVGSGVGAARGVPRRSPERGAPAATGGSGPGHSGPGSEHSADAGVCQRTQLCRQVPGQGRCQRHTEGQYTVAYTVSQL